MINEQVDNIENIESDISVDNNIIILNNNIKNYLASDVLKVKSYSFDEISGIDKTINLSTNIIESDIYNKNMVSVPRLG